jgi:hypothetical protein
MNDTTELIGVITPSLQIVANIIATGPKGDVSYTDGTLVYYEYIQTLPSAIWEIEHNLNKFPTVTVTDSAGSVVEGDIYFVNYNKIRIEFSVAFSGKAYLN